MNVHVRGRVRNGRLVVDEPTDLPDGTEVELVADVTGPASPKARPRFGSMAGRIKLAADFDTLPDEFGEYT